MRVLVIEDDEELAATVAAGLRYARMAVDVAFDGEALVRRAQPSIPPVLEHGDVVLEAAKRCAQRSGRELELTPKEFGALELLLAAQGRVVSAEELLERVWDENADPFTGAVRIMISRLRAKLGDPPVIETLAKASYRVAGH
jgi:DNA-binding response OmpR family regulator